MGRLPLTAAVGFTEEEGKTRRRERGKGSTRQSERLSAVFGALWHSGAPWSLD
uniref:Uncharacterized protein n=1 Tax=Anguilla anguilla TaxID=7936 RepID=A0A0E9XVX6_ANGAN